MQKAHKQGYPRRTIELKCYFCVTQFSERYLTIRRVPEVFAYQSELDLSNYNYSVGLDSLYKAAMPLRMLSVQNFAKNELAAVRLTFMTWLDLIHNMYSTLYAATHCSS